jgi:hypothetical protein
VPFLTGDDSTFVLESSESACSLLKSSIVAFKFLDISLAAILEKKRPQTLLRIQNGVPETNETAFYLRRKKDRLLSESCYMSGAQMAGLDHGTSLCFFGLPPPFCGSSC